MGGRLPFYYGWVVVGTISTVLMATSGARFLYGVVLKPVSDQFGWDRASLTLAVMINMVALSALQPVVGLLADRIGAKRVLVGGTLAIAGMLVPLSFATQLWQVYLLYGVIGAIGFAATSPVNTTTLVNRWFTKRRGTALSIATAGTAFGQLIVVPAAAWTLTLTDWVTTMRVLAGVLVLVMAPIAVLLLRDEPAQVDEEIGGRGARHNAESTGRMVRQNAQTVRTSSPIERESASLRQSLGTSAFWVLSWGFLVCGFTMAFANTHFMAFADDMGMHATDAADVVAVTAVFSIIGTVLLGMTADRYRRPPVLGLTYALRGASFLLLFVLPQGPPMFVYAIVLGVSWTATTPLTAAIAADIYGRANLGIIFGTMFTFMNVGAGIGAYLDGFIYDRMGHYDLALLINGVIGLSAAAAMAFVRERSYGDWVPEAVRDVRAPEMPDTAPIRGD